MPELPEVETIACEMRRHGIPGRKITGVRVFWPRTLEGHSPKTFSRGLLGRTIETVDRRAKFLVIRLSGSYYLLVHLRMTGRFQLAEVRSSPAPGLRLEVELEDGRALRFYDSRKFGRWRLTREPGGILDRLGPEPLGKGFSAADFVARLQGRRRQLKPLLLDQAFLAGIGNIYADEALWEAGLSPQRLAHSLSRREAVRLLGAIRLVLRRGIRNSGTSLGQGRPNFVGVYGLPGRNQDALKVFRRTGRPCPRCGTPIRRMVVAQRGTHICPVCQPASAP
jgi:formamidopyrimidine-DNA glycosylase